MSMNTPLSVPGVTHAQLTELAYVLACCLHDSQQPEILLAALESQLDITSGQARMLQNLAQNAGMQSYSSAKQACPALEEYTDDPAKAGFLAMLVWAKLLPHMAGQQFASHPDFYASCTSVANSVAAIAKHLAGNTCSACKISASPDTASRMMAALRGHTRRLCEPEEQFYNKQEFQACGTDIDSTIGRLVGVLKQGGKREIDLVLCVSLILLGIQYDDLSDTGYIDGRDEILSIVEDQVLAKLGVHAGHLALLNSWVHCDQFLASHETAHLLALQGLLRSHISAGGSDSSEMSLADHAHTCRLAKKLRVRSGIGAKLRALAEDSFESLSAAQLPLVLDIVKACSSTVEDVHDLLLESVNSSTEMELGRVWSEEVGDLRSSSVTVLDADQLHSRLHAVQALIRVRTAYVQQVDDEMGPPVSGFATMVRRCHHCMGKYFCAWRDCGVDALGEHAEVVRQAALLELYLLEQLQGCGATIEPSKLWASAEALQPLQFSWLEGRNSEIQEFAARMLNKETWKQPISGTQHFPETPIELQRLCAAAVSAILEMDVPTSGTVIRTQLEVLCGLVTSFCAAVMRGCEDPSKLIRPSPPLTRYKEKLFQKVLIGAAVKNGMAKLEKEDPEYVRAMDEYKRQLSKRAELSIENLLLRLNSVCHVEHAMSRLMERTKSEYSQVVSRYSMDQEKELAAMEGCTAATAQALSNAEATLQQCLANSAVFVDMSEIWYDQLYKTEVKGSRAEDVGAIGRLDGLLSQIMDKSLPQTAETTAHIFATATFAAMQHVLLHGGQFRYYSVQDSDILQADLHTLKALFSAEGQGVSMELLTEAAAPAQDVIHAMSIPTTVLAEAMDGLIGNKQTRASGSIPKSCQNVDTLKCILSHRRDRAASKYLKDRVKMPKMDGKRRGCIC
eukprot:jgi/Ulvmu1/4383/UM002_0108.1